MSPLKFVPPLSVKLPPVTLMTMVVADVSFVNVMLEFGGLELRGAYVEHGDAVAGVTLKARLPVTVLFAVSALSWVWSALSGVVKSLIAKDGLFCLIVPTAIQIECAGIAGDEVYAAAIVDVAARAALDR